MGEPQSCGREPELRFPARQIGVGDSGRGAVSERRSTGQTPEAGTGRSRSAPYLFVDPVNRTVTEALNALRMQLAAGVALGKALRTAAPICGSLIARRCMQQAADEIDRGASFDDAMWTLCPALSFPERAILSAGWSAGRIEPAMTAVIRRREVMYQTRREIRSRLVLPMVQLFLAGFIINAPDAVLGRIPLTGYLLRSLGPFAVVIAVFAGLRLFQIYTTRRNAGRELSAPPPPATIIDRLLLSLPIFAMVQRWRNRSEFAATMSTLLGAGLGMLAALEVVARSLPNGVYRMQIVSARERIEAQGISLAEALPRGRFWPAEWLASLEAAYMAGEEERVLGRLGEDGRERYLSAVKTAGFWFAFIVYMAVLGYLALTVVQGWASIYSQLGM